MSHRDFYRDISTSPAVLGITMFLNSTFDGAGNSAHVLVGDAGSVI